MFPLNFLPGDATRDRVVNALDLAEVKRRLNSTTSVQVGSGYGVVADVTGDGRINALDVSAVKRRLNSRLAVVTVSALAPPPSSFRQPKTSVDTGGIASLLLFGS